MNVHDKTDCDADFDHESEYTDNLDYKEEERDGQERNKWLIGGKRSELDITNISEDLIRAMYSN